MKLKNNKWIQNYNNWLSKGDEKEIHWANLKRQFLHCYDYCKIALDEKTLSEDEMESKGTALNAWMRTRSIPHSAEIRCGQLWHQNVFEKHQSGWSSADMFDVPEQTWTIGYTIFNKRTNLNHCPYYFQLKGQTWTIAYTIFNKGSCRRTILVFFA